MRARPALAPALLLIAGTLGCSSSDTLATSGCDPLVPEQCGFPFPSNVWLVDDPTTPTGHHVQFGPKTLPPQRNKRTDPTPWRASDGFSPGQAALTYLPGASASGLPDENHLRSRSRRSRRPSCSTPPAGSCCRTSPRST